MSYPDGLHFDRCPEPERFDYDDRSDCGGCEGCDGRRHRCHRSGELAPCVKYGHSTPEPFACVRCERGEKWPHEPLWRNK